MTRPDPAPIDGMKTVWGGFVMSSSDCVWRWRSGTDMIPSLRNGCSVSAVIRAITAKTLKNAFFYLDATPSHSFLKYLYKYPQAPFPYASLVEENSRRSRADPPFSLLDTGIFAEKRYWDVEITYAKETPDTIFVRIQVSKPGAGDRYPAPAAQPLVPEYLVLGWMQNRRKTMPAGSRIR